MRLIKWDDIGRLKSLTISCFEAFLLSYFLNIFTKFVSKSVKKNSFEPLEPLLDLFSSITFSSALLVALIFQASLKDCKTFYREKVSTLKVETLLG